MSIHILLMLAILIISALINWRMSKLHDKLREYLSRLGLGFSIIIIFDGVTYAPLPYSRLLTLAPLIFFPLHFFATDYIHYIKNKNDVKCIQKTLKHAIYTIVNISIIGLILMRRLL